MVPTLLSQPSHHTQHQLMWSSTLFSSYSQLIAEWPMAMLLLCLAFIFLCTLAGLLGSPPLDFSEPLLVRSQGRERNP